MAIRVDVQYMCESPSLPGKKQIKTWAEAALKNLRENAEFTVRIVDRQEGTELNERWRQAKGPTNVLSFPAEGLEEIAPELLGDIVICAPVIEDEAKQQDKSPDAHWAHMIVHGILHLLSYDHIKQQDADIMEALEIKILEKIGYKNPYV